MHSGAVPITGDSYWLKLCESTNEQNKCKELLATGQQSNSSNTLPAAEPICPTN